MGVENLGGGAGAAVGGAVGGGLSSGAEVASGALGPASSGTLGFTPEVPTFSPGMTSGLFSGPEIPPSLGEPDLLGGRRGSLVDFQLAFDFGSEHQLSGEIFSQDKVVSNPESIFKESFFETLVKPQVPAETSSLTEIFGPKLETVEATVNEGPVSPGEFGFLVPEESFALPVSSKKKRPGKSEAEESITSHERTSWEIILGKEAVGVVDGEELKPKERSQAFETETLEDLTSKSDQENSASFFEVSPLPQTEIGTVEGPEVLVPQAQERELPEPTLPFDGEHLEQSRPLPKEVNQPIFQVEKTVYVEEKVTQQVAVGKVEPEAERETQKGQVLSIQEEVTHQLTEGKVEPETELESQKEVAVATQLATSDEYGGKGKVISPEKKGQAEPPEDEEPKEPLWKVSGKKGGGEEIESRVLERRFNIAKEIVEEGVKETMRGETGSSWFASNVAKRLGKIDVPTFKEAVKIIFGKLTFPLVAGKAQEDIYRLKPEEINPGGVLRSLSERLRKEPPLEITRGRMEDKGTLAQSNLVEVSKEAAVLAQEGAEHIIYEPRVEKWVRVDKKPSQYPLELDKTKKKVAVAAREPSIDRGKSPWYTLFAERAEAQAKRKKPNLNEKRQIL